MNKLRADLVRFQALTQDVSQQKSGLRLWVASLHPRMVPVVLLRLAEATDRRGWGRLAKLFSILNLVVFGLEVSSKVSIGGGLFLPHTVGTVIGAERIGENCTIHQGVTLGAAEVDLGFSPNTRPIIGNEVFIGAGAKVIGHVSVGDFARIGTNAVVVKDVPPFALAIGVPATCTVSSKIDPTGTV